MTSSKKRRYQIADWIMDLIPFQATLWPILLGFVEYLKIDDWEIRLMNIEKFPAGKYIYFLTLFLVFFFALINYLTSNKISQVEEENRKKSEQINELESAVNNLVEQTNEMLSSYLNLAFENLNYSSKERISVYKIIEERFILIGRFSNNPIFKKPGRSFYSINEGFIGKAWENGEFHIDNLPDPSKYFNLYYKAVVAESNIPKDTLSKMKMRSRNYYIKRLPGFDRNAKAVLVFESIDENSLNIENINETIDKVKDQLIIFIERNNGKEVTKNQIENE